MNEILLTFGIPVYNSGKYMNELIRCFNLSCQFNYEIIIIDDGSTDNSYKFCNEIKNNNKQLNIKLFHQENHGVSYTRNKIIENSSGKWITFIDSDDLINFDLYCKYFEKTRDKNLDLYINTYTKKKYNRLKRRKFSLSYLIESEIINSPCTKFYKKEILINNNIFFNSEFDLGEDLIFNLKVYKKARSIDYFYSDIYSYRKINENSLTKKYRNNKFEQLMYLNKCCYDLVDNDEKIYKALEFIRIKNNISCVCDYVRFISNEETLKKISCMKTSYKKEFRSLNSLCTTLIYDLWYLLPNKILIKIMAVKNKWKR